MPPQAPSLACQLSKGSLLRSHIREAEHGRMLAFRAYIIALFFKPSSYQPLNPVNPRFTVTLQLLSTQNSSFLTLRRPASQGWKCPIRASPEAAAEPKHSCWEEGRQQKNWETPASCLWLQNCPKGFTSSRARDTHTGIGVLPVVSTQGGRHAKPAGICEAFQSSANPRGDAVLTQVHAPPVPVPTDGVYHTA